MDHRSCLFLVSLLAACGVMANVPALEPAGKKIKLVSEADKPLDCEPVADVAGTARAEDEKEALKGAKNDIRNKAGEYQANFVVVDTQRTRNAGTGPYKEVFVGGKAMQCVTPEMEAQKEKEEAEAKERAEREAMERERQEELERAKQEAEAQDEDEEE